MSSIGTFFHEQLARLIGERTARTASGELARLPGSTRPISLPCVKPDGGGKAAITGDYALIGSEVPEVVKTLRANGIDVTAIHSHMLTEEPRIIFLHF
jgi:hypothetical protein